MPTEEPHNDRSPGIEEIIDALNSPRRRHIIDFLGEHGSAHFNDVVEYVADQEFDGDYDSEERRRVYISIYQTHAPLLDEYGLAEYRGSDNPMYPTDDLERAAEALKTLRGEDQKGITERVSGWFQKEQSA